MIPLVRGLEIQSASQDMSLTAALTLVLAHENRRSKWLSAEDLDLSFMSDRQAAITPELHQGKHCQYGIALNG